MRRNVLTFLFSPFKMPSIVSISSYGCVFVCLRLSPFQNISGHTRAVPACDAVGMIWKRVDDALNYPIYVEHNVRRATSHIRSKCVDKSPFINAELGGYDEFNKLRNFGHSHLHDTFKSMYGVLFGASSYQIIIGKAIYLVREYD